MRTIMINPALNGYVCQVGCQQVVFESRGALLAALAEYLHNPEAVEKQFQSRAVNPMQAVPFPQERGRTDGQCCNTVAEAGECCPPPIGGGITQRRTGATSR